MRVNVKRRIWRVQGNGRRVPRIKWEVLLDEDKKEEYMESTRVKLEEKE